MREMRKAPIIRNHNLLGVRGRENYLEDVKKQVLRVLLGLLRSGVLSSCLRVFSQEIRRIFSDDSTEKERHSELLPQYLRVDSMRTLPRSVGTESALLCIRSSLMEYGSSWR